MKKLEIERKFLVDINKVPYDFSKLNREFIEQGYIIYKPEIRVRSVSGSEYFMTIKGNTDDATVRNEIEFKISKEAFSTLMARDDVNKISKNRYTVNEGNNIYEIDVFEGKLKGLACLEVEFPTKEDADCFSIPSWIKKEVTDDVRYRNSFLARNDIPKDM